MALSKQITNQVLIDAIYLTADDLKINRFDLVDRADLWGLFFDRPAVYTGAPIVALPGLADAERQGIQRKLIESLARRQNPTAATLAHLNLRSGPGVQYDVLQTLPPDTQLQVLGEEGDWVRVQVDERRGYVYRDYVKLPNYPIKIRLLVSQPDLLRVPLAPPPAFALDDHSLATGTLAWTVAHLWNRYGGLLAVLANEFAIAPGIALAVLLAESGGRAFAPGPAGPRMIIRFENHIFYDRWGRNHRETFDRHFSFAPGRTWTGHRWRPAAGAPWQEFHGDQGKEWQVYEFAARLDRRTARESTSMGLPQIMGFNAPSVGYPHADALFDAFASSEARQILGFFDFVRSRSGISPLRSGDFVTFAQVYNGPGQAPVYGAIIQERADIFARLWQQKIAPSARGVGLESIPVAPDDRPPGDGERALLRRQLAGLLVDQRRSLLLHQALLVVGCLTILSGVVFSFLGGVGVGLPPLLVGLAALIAYAYMRPDKMRAGFQAKIAAIERLIVHSERLPW